MLQQVEANACKHRIKLVASASGKPVPVHAVIALVESDDRFYRTSPLPPSQQGAGPFLAKPVDHLNVDLSRVVVSTIAEAAVGVFAWGRDTLGVRPGVRKDPARASPLRSASQSPDR